MGVTISGFRVIRNETKERETGKVFARRWVSCLWCKNGFRIVQGTKEQAWESRRVLLTLERRRRKNPQKGRKVAWTHAEAACQTHKGRRGEVKARWLKTDQGQRLLYSLSSLVGTNPKKRDSDSGGKSIHQRDSTI